MNAAPAVERVHATEIVRAALATYRREPLRPGVSVGAHGIYGALVEAFVGLLVVHLASRTAAESPRAG